MTTWKGKVVYEEKRKRFFDWKALKRILRRVDPDPLEDVANCREFLEFFRESIYTSIRQFSEMQRYLSYDENLANRAVGDVTRIAMVGTSLAIFLPDELKGAMARVGFPMAIRYMELFIERWRKK